MDIELITYLAIVSLIFIIIAVASCYFFLRKVEEPKQRRFIIQITLATLFILFVIDLLRVIFAIPLYWLQIPLCGVIIPLAIYFGNKHIKKLSNT